MAVCDDVVDHLFDDDGVVRVKDDGDVHETGNVQHVVVVDQTSVKLRAHEVLRRLFVR